MVDVPALLCYHQGIKDKEVRPMSFGTNLQYLRKLTGLPLQPVLREQ